MSWILEKHQVHMTVASSLKMRGDEPNIQNDLQMVKAALLYADHAKLVSIQSFGLLDVIRAFKAPHADRLLQLRQYFSSIDDETKRENVAQWIADYEYAKRHRHSKRGRELLKQLDDALDKGYRKAQEQNAEYVTRLGADGIFDAVNSRLLDIYEFKSIFDRAIRDTLEADDLELEYISAVSEVISDAQAYPLFDLETALAIGSRLNESHTPIAPSGVSRSKEVALAADLLARLPLFERATVKEILDVRRELEKPLQTFRSVMVKFSSKIESASWDKDFARDADQVFRSEVAPAILALEDEEKSNTFLNKLTAKVADKSIQVGGAVSASSAISALAVRMLNLPLTDVAALAVGPAIVAGGVAYSAYKEWREKQKEIEGNSLFFYYKAGSLLQDGSFRYEDRKPQ
jgi:hypothetical protein